MYIMESWWFNHPNLVLHKHVSLHVHVYVCNLAQSAELELVELKHHHLSWVELCTQGS